MTGSALHPSARHDRDWRAFACIVAGALLVLDAVFLMSLRVFSLGVTLPLAIGCMLLFVGLRWEKLHGWLDEKESRRKVWRLGLVAALFWLFSLLAFWSVLVRASATADVAGFQPKAVIVLGSGTPGGKVSPVLAARLDLALEAAARHPGALVVVSGGVGINEQLSEARVMGDYLRARGLPAARIVQEEESDSTEQNLRFSKPMLQARGISPQDPVLVVSSDFHTVRAGWIARRAGYSQVALAGAPTPLYIRYNAWLREYFAAIAGLLLREFA